MENKSGRRFESPPAFNLRSSRLRLEDDLGRKLPDARRANGSGRVDRTGAGAGPRDLPECSRAGACRRIGEVGVVPGIENFGLELAMDALFGSNVLEERQVRILVARPAQVIARNVTEGLRIAIGGRRGRVLREGSGVEPLCLRSAGRTPGADAGEDRIVIADAGL